jgi:hygromycin-B 7''-O-kinase
MDDILEISEPEYVRRFHEPTFGLGLAQVVCARHGLAEPLTRQIEGSSLAFRIGDGRWLKITPPFFAGSFETELEVARGVEGQLRFPVPTILEAGELDGWKYIISASVPGVQLQHVISDLTEADLEAVAVDLGRFMASLHGIHIPGFKGNLQPWGTHLARCIRDAEQIHLSRRNGPDTARQIAELLADQQHRLVRLGPPVLVHGDLTPEHVMVDHVSGRWRVSGILDLADAMLAPAELDATVPMVDIFRGRRDLQRRFLREAGIALVAEPEGFSLLFMAVALLHPFSFFEDWFSPEIESGLSGIAEIAGAVFPD